MAGTGDARRGSFWIWATLLIVIAVVVLAVVSARDNSEDEGQTTPPVETGRTP
jgi:uncharacterized membrane protein YhaH (DUF805 family)